MWRNSGSDKTKENTEMECLYRVKVRGLLNILEDTACLVKHIHNYVLCKYL